MDDRNGAPLFQIEIGIVVPAVIYAPVWLADQRGFLRDEGLTVRLRSFGSTDATTAALRDGVVPITIGSPEGSIANALNGGEWLSVADDHHLLFVHCLELEPLARSLSRVVQSRRALSDHAFFMRSLGF